MSEYISQWVECGGIYYPEYKHERDDFDDDDDTESSPTLNDFSQTQEF